MKLYMFGNGLSRKGVDIKEVSKNGVTVGFNTAYIEYPFDIVASMDIVATKEITRNMKSGMHLMRNNSKDPNAVYINNISNKVLVLPDMPTGSGGGWDSGRMAIYTLSELFRPSEIYLFGFDFSGGNLRHSNIFKPPPNYEHCWNFVFDKIKCIVVTDKITEFHSKLKCESITYKDFYSRNYS